MNGFIYFSLHCFVQSINYPLVCVKDIKESNILDPRTIIDEGERQKGSDFLSTHVFVVL